MDKGSIDDDGDLISKKVSKSGLQDDDGFFTSFSGDLLNGFDAFFLL